MATYSRVKTFVANETLTASDLNAEFNNIITNTNSGNLNSDNVSTSSAWTWTGYHTYSTSSRIALSDDIYMTLGNATDGDYRVRYNATSTALEIMSTDSDGAGTDAVVLDIQDGTDDLRLRGGFSTDNNTAPTSGIVTGGNIVSDTDGTDDLGTTSVRWANLYVDAATITNNLTVGGTLTLTGGLTLNGNVTVGDNASDTLTINSTITSNLLFTDNTYDIGASGATRPRDLHLSRNALMGGTLGVTGLITASGGVSGALTGDVTGNVTGGTISGTTGTFSGDLAVDTDTLFVDASADRVGINTSSADASLHIIGGDGDPSAVHSGNAKMILENNGTTFLEIATGTTHYGGITFSDDVATRGAVVYDHGTALGGGADSLHFQTAGSIKAVITSAGLLGIGTSSPTGLLNLMADGATPAAAATPVLLDIKRGVTNSSANNNTAIRLGNNSNGFQISYGGSADHLQFIDGGANAAVTILNGGSVGIGTSSPAATLHLQHPSQSSGYWEDKGLLIHEDATADRGIALYSRGGSEHYIASLIDDANSYLIIGARKSSATNGVDAITVRGSGNVGIGTSSPTATFTVAPTAHDAGVPAVWLHSADNAQDHDGTVISSVNNGSDAEVLHVRTNNTTYANGTSLMLVRGDGLVGINDTSPDFALDCNVPSGNLSSIAACFTTNAANATISFQGTGTTDNSSCRFGIYDNDNLYMRQDDANTFYFGEDAKFGINTMAPSYKIHAVGAAGTNAAFVLEESTSGVARKARLQQNSGATILAADGTGNSLIIETAGSESVRFLSSGGMTFNGDTAAANALDDYEEGTWTPTYLGDTSNPSVTYSNQTGNYTKIGNIVWISGYILVATNNLTGGSGALQIGGLPFNVDEDSPAAYQFLSGGYNMVNGTVTGNDFRLQANNLTKLDFYGVNSTPTWSSASGYWEHSFIGVLKID